MDIRSSYKAGIVENIVVGYKAEQVKECMGSRVKYAIQQQQLGTGHALMQAKELFGSKQGYLLCCVETPLVTAKTIYDTIEYHKKQLIS